MQETEFKESQILEPCLDSAFAEAQEIERRGTQKAAASLVLGWGHVLTVSNASAIGASVVPTALEER